MSKEDEEIQVDVPFPQTQPKEIPEPVEEPEELPEEVPAEINRCR